MVGGVGGDGYGVGDFCHRCGVYRWLLGGAQADEGQSLATGSVDDAIGNLKVHFRRHFLAIWLIIDGMIFRPSLVLGLCFYCRVPAMGCVVEVFR